MSGIANIMKVALANALADTFDVSENWTVTDAADYPTGELSEAEKTAVEQEKSRRATEAENGTARLQRLAGEFHAADEDCASSIHSIIGDIAALTPLSSALGGGIAEQIADKITEGKTLTDFERRVLELGATLSRDQMAALWRGATAEISQGQFEFLQEITGQLGGKTMAEVLALGEGPRHKEIQHHLASAVEMLGIPNVKTEAGDAGGMDQLPENIRTILTSNLDTGQAVIDDAPDDGARVYHLTEGLESFYGFSRFISQGNDFLQGSDVNRGLLKQVAELSGVSASDPIGSHALRSGEFELLDEELRQFLSDTLYNAAMDRTAVHDFLTGDNMDVTCDNGGRYVAGTHVEALLQYEWGDNTSGAEAMLRWNADVGPSGNAYQVELAHGAAEALGHHLGSEEFIATNERLGLTNPQLARELADTLHPYLGSFSGADGLAGLPEYGVKSLEPSELERLFQSLSTDPEAAARINTEASKWQNLMAYAYGMDPTQAALPERAGMLSQAMIDGNTAAREHMSAEQQREYQNNLEALSLVKDIAGLFPYADKAAVLIQPSLILGDEPTMADVESEYNNPESIASLNDPLAHKFSIFSGYAAANPAWVAAHPEFFEDGKPSWEKATEDEHSRNIFINLVHEISGGVGPVVTGWEGAFRSGNRASDSPHAPYQPGE